MCSGAGRAASRGNPCAATFAMAGKLSIMGGYTKKPRLDFSVVFSQREWEMSTLIKAWCQSGTPDLVGLNDLRPQDDPLAPSITHMRDKNRQLGACGRNLCRDSRPLHHFWNIGDSITDVGATLSHLKNVYSLLDLDQASALFYCQKGQPTIVNRFQNDRETYCRGRVRVPQHLLLFHSSSPC